MHENIVAVVLSERFQGKNKIGGRYAEDRFYARLAHPAPLWLVRMLACVTGQAVGGQADFGSTGSAKLCLAEASRQGRIRFSGTGPEPKGALPWHRLRLPKA